MSFSDMMESSRGPGVIGTLLALVVLAIFVLFYLFAFDEGMQGGGKTIGSVIAEQEADIRRIKGEISTKGKNLERLPALKELEKKLAATNLDNRGLASQIISLQENVQSTTSEVAEKVKEFEAYKDNYRTFVRNKAKGETLEKLETTKETYDNVSIREVTAIGMQIRHDGGLKRVPYEELPRQMQDYYQFDTAQKNQAIAMEDSMRKQHETAVGVAENKAAEGVALQKDNAINEDREKTAQRILALEGQIKVLENDIDNLRSDLSRASAAAASARAMGRIHLDKSGQISREINSKQTRIQNLRAEINRTQR